MSKGRLPKPVRGRDKLIGGIPYFEIIVSIFGTMYLSSTFRFNGQPYVVHFRFFKGKALFIKSTEFKISGPYDDEKSLHDSGIIKKEARKDNLHRTFRFNSKDYEFCKRLVDRQDLSMYMKLFIR